MKDRWYCKECRKVCTDDQILQADHPFIQEWSISGCPHCREPRTLVSACYACDKPGPNGRKYDDGIYRWACSKHYSVEVTK